MKYVIVDVREPEEFERGHAQGALNIPPHELLSGAGKLQDISKSTPIILYCNSGNRSNVAIQILRSLGYTNLVNGINKDHVEAKYLSSGTD